jgi:uncharacterized protein
MPGPLHAILTTTDHRPWPLPAEPWVMVQRWHELLFAHWPVAATVLRPLIPQRLALDAFDGQCWLGVIPFRMSGVRLRGMPALPGLSRFPELNVRTYVTVDGKPGVWFFSLDAANATAVAVARAWFHLPYFRARMRSIETTGWIDYRSERRHPGAPPAGLAVRYWPSGPPRQPRLGTLEHWLTERYCLYVADGHGAIFRGEIHHAPWNLRNADAGFVGNTMAAALGVSLPHVAPLLCFAELQEVVVWQPERIA